ncbi:hypothetical protein ACQP2T_60125 [Nonomuraea sp. CA-143628]|uniref:hypothetical protein n=1 Tax=Nonomuraea sp. CA-143628 TaxID=3239997 RepID=UPI003D94476E
MLEFRIEWKASNFADTEYGFVGKVKAFSITRRQTGEGRCVLSPRLPDEKGMKPKSEEFFSTQLAKDRANVLLRQFLADLGLRLANSPVESEPKRRA